MSEPGRLIPVSEPGRLVLVLGGARGGKSGFADQLAADIAASRGGRVTYLATSETNDVEMAARVAAHRAARPAAWTTIECPREVPAAIRAHAADSDIFLLDCVTFWISNLLLTGDAFGGANPGDDFNYDKSLLSTEQEQAAVARVSAAVDDLLAALAKTGATLIAVSNEVGLGVVPEYPLARLYRDELGRANQRLAAAADQVYLLVAGLPLDLKALAAKSADAIPPSTKPKEPES